MKLKNPIYIAIITATLISSCGSTSTMVSTNVANIDKIPLKVSPIKEADLKRWSHLDLSKDTIPGMSVDKAYTQLLKGKKPTKVIVAVLDSGVDIDHEDLKSIIWTNPKEIAGNGIDDDKNGFIDDIHGWNFLGNAQNENIELVRILKKGDGVSQEFLDIKADYDKQYQDIQAQKQQVDFIFKANKTIQTYLKKDNYTSAELDAIKTSDTEIDQSKQVMQNILMQTGPDFNSELNDYKKQVYDQLNFNLNMEFDGRKIVGDDPENLNDKNYGNNTVYGPDKNGAVHGTHVAGIIAGVRGNKKGGDGIANDVAIMVIRAVPNGDEYDKDIALGIRYAVDNGAKVINGSFGKSYSPNKQWVFDAIKYAESKDVLFVHAAGNDGHNIDLPENKNYPNDADGNNPEFAKNVLTIGALNTTYGSGIVANFSNFGTTNVDVFSPGMKIYASVPFDKYKYEQGTSMASPNVAGVAALIREYYPSLTAIQVKQIIMDSGTPITTTVTVGEKQEKMPFSDTCKSGKIVNAYNALLMAEQMTKK
jgi:cell wall-associated protease